MGKRGGGEDGGDGNRPSKKPKVHISFDDEARKDYLGGFRKRKKERRVKGLAFGKVKARRERLEARKQRREEDPVRKHKLVVPELKQERKELETLEYDTEEIVEQWGDVVTVTTSLGLPEEQESDMPFDDEEATGQPSRT